MATSSIVIDLPKTPARVGNNGTPAWRSYAILRRNLDSILEMERHRDTFSENQIARHLGVSRNMYQNIREILRRRQESIAEGNWDEVEIELFGRFGSYRDLPFYKKAMAYIEDGPPNPKMSVVPTVGKPGRPKGSKNRPKPAKAGQGTTEAPAPAPAAQPTGTASAPPASVTPEVQVLPAAAPAVPPTADVNPAAPAVAQAPVPVVPTPAAATPARPSFFRAPSERRANIDHLPKTQQLRVEQGSQQGELFKGGTPVEEAKKA